MIDVKQAVASAREFAQSLLGTSDLLLEEVNSQENKFNVTFSFPERQPGVGVRQPQRPIFGQTAREFKTFDIDKATGNVMGMSIREIF